VPHVTLKSIANNPDIKEGMTRAEIDAAIARDAETELLYDQPYDGFWRLSYRIYRRAELLNILDTAIRVETAGNDCIHNSFKNLLVFYLSDTGLLTQREMKALFNLFNHREVPVKIYTELKEDKADLFFGIKLQDDLPPLPIRRMGPREGELRYVTTIKAARLACQYLKGKNAKQDSLEAGNYSLFLKIGKVLGMQTSRQYSRVTEKRSCPGLVGVNKVLRFLMQQNSSALAAAMQILPPNLSHVSSGWGIPELSLVPQGEEEDHRRQDNLNVSALGDENLLKLFADAAGNANLPGQGSKKQGLPEKDGALFEKIEIVDSSVKDYSILLKKPKAPVKVGELFGILNSADDRLELGLVRRITNGGKNAAELVVELISLQAGIGCIWRPKKMHEAQLVLLLPGTAALQQKDSIIYPTHAIAVGETIVILQGEKKVLRLVNKLLHTTSVFSHAELAAADSSSPGS
jgi:hypothetical protein